MTRKDYLLIVVGMLGVVAYLCHVLLGDFLLTGHNIVTMSIERITQIRTPYTIYMKILLWFFSISMLVFSFGMYSIFKKSYDDKIAYIWLMFFLPAQILFYYNANMLSGNYYNVLTILFTILFIVTFTLASYLYIENPKTKKFGIFLSVISIVFIILSIFYLITVFANLEIIGLSQRLMILSLLVYIFSISNFECFNDMHSDKK